MPPGNRTFDIIWAVLFQQLPWIFFYFIAVSFERMPLFHFVVSLVWDVAAWASYQLFVLMKYLVLKKDLSTGFNDKTSHHYSNNKIQYIVPKVV